MLDILRHDPWLIVVCLAFFIPIVAIVLGKTTSYLARVRQAELEANLKRDMLERGMTAEEIQIVIEATARRDAKTCARGSAMRQEMS
jgi:hypothetical protein